MSEEPNWPPRTAAEGIALAEAALPEHRRKALNAEGKAGPGLLDERPRTLAEGIRAAMRASKTTGLELAAYSGLHPNTIGMYLGGTRGPRLPRVDHLRAVTIVLARRMGVEVDDLWAEFGRLLPVEEEVVADS